MRIPLDNRTRWNSWYVMLQKALEAERHIDFYVKNQPDLKLDSLKPKEWEMLRTVSAFLARFEAHTKQLESDQSDISQVLIVMFHVRYWIIQNKEKYTRKDGQVKNISSLYHLF